MKQARNGKWRADYECVVCQCCSARFTLFRRRHHCRECGNIYCSACTQCRIPLPGLYKGELPQRVCQKCYSLVVAGRKKNSVTLQDENNTIPQYSRHSAKTDKKSGGAPRSGDAGSNNNGSMVYSCGSSNQRHSFQTPGDSGLDFSCRTHTDRPSHSQSYVDGDTDPIEASTLYRAEKPNMDEESPAVSGEPSGESDTNTTDPHPHCATEEINPVNDIIAAAAAAAAAAAETGAQGAVQDSKSSHYVPPQGSRSQRLSMHRRHSSSEDDEERSEHTSSTTTTQRDEPFRGGYDDDYSSDDLMSAPLPPQEVLLRQAEAQQRLSYVDASFYTNRGSMAVCNNMNGPSSTGTPALSVQNSMASPSADNVSFANGDTTVLQPISSLFFLPALQDGIRDSEAVMTVLLYPGPGKEQTMLVTVSETETMGDLVDRLADSYFKLDFNPFRRPSAEQLVEQRAKLRFFSPYSEVGREVLARDLIQQGQKRFVLTGLPLNMTTPLTVSDAPPACYHSRNPDSRDGSPSPAGGDSMGSGSPLGADTTIPHALLYASQLEDDRRRATSSGPCAHTQVSQHSIRSFLLGSDSGGEETLHDIEY